jgi:hypothetical protein
MDVMLGGMVQNLQRHGAPFERVHVDAYVVKSEAR